MMPFWSTWVGLPWQWGADPRDGEGACCFRSSQAVRETLGLSWPAERMQGWYELARADQWQQLRHDWTKNTYEVQAPKAGTLLQFEKEDGSFGVGCLVSPSAAVIVKHESRLYVLTHHYWHQLPLFELKA